MFDFEILTPGAKIKAIRLHLRMTQDEMAIGMHRSLISKIEKEQVLLTLETAEKLAKNINNYIKSHSINTNYVTAAFLLEDREVQIEKINKKYACELLEIKNFGADEGFINNKIEEINKYIEDNRIYNCLSLYEYIYELLYEYHRYIECKPYVLKCIDISGDLRDLKNYVKFHSLLTKLYHSLKEYDDAIIAGYHTIYIAKKYNVNDAAIYNRVYFNIALAHKKLGEYYKALEYLEIYKKYVINMHDVLDYKIMRAICLARLGRYTEAEVIYIEALQEAILHEELDCISNIYQNLVYLYVDHLNDMDKYRFYIDKLKNCKRGNDDLISAQSLYCSVKCGIKMNDRNIVEDNFHPALNSLIEIKNIDKLKELIEDVFKYYYENNEYRFLERFLSILKNKIINNKIKGKWLLTIFFKTAFKLKDIHKEKSDKIFVYYNEIMEKV